MNQDQAQNDLASIRNIMERSSKFISLSGLSGILAGFYALAGVFFAYYIIYSNGFFNTRTYQVADAGTDVYRLVLLIAVAVIVLVASLITCFLLSAAKAKRKGQPMWGGASKALLFNMAAPLVTGGILVLIFINRGYYGIIAPSTLIFYGLALIGAGNFTFTDVKYLGIIEIVLGLAAAIYPGFGLAFWAAGFGVMHIIYGSIVYLKYDK